MLKEKLLDDLKNSMKEKNVIRKNVIQMVRAAILQVEKDKQIEVSDDQIVEIIAKEAKKIKVTKVVFDRGGYLYHGRVAALADAARANGLEF